MFYETHQLHVRHLAYTALKYDMFGLICSLSGWLNGGKNCFVMIVSQLLLCDCGYCIGTRKTFTGLLAVFLK